LPPIVRDANRLLVLTEEVVRRFPRYHKYAVGADLRRQAMLLARLANRAWRDTANQAEHVARLVWGVDEFKLTLQLAKTIKAFSSFAQFEQCAELAAQLGKQSGGWGRRLSRDGQQGRAGRPAPRPDSLSARATHEVSG
jgi:hypothetical protein